MDYLDDIIECPKAPAPQGGQQTAPAQNYPNLREAFNFANECRDKEIDRFWTRGLYFWGFIAASFAAYMAVFTRALGQNDLTLGSILALSGISKAALFVLSFICFVFCLSWQLAHKASKFWQKNWETHVSFLEKDYIGLIYDRWIVKNKGRCPFTVKPYDYSVSKISSLCSILLLYASSGLALFHAAICIQGFAAFIKGHGKWFEIILPLLPLAAIAFMFFYYNTCKGNEKGKRNKKKHNKATVYFNKHTMSKRNCDFE
ncbi:MAG: hypothetical protein IJU95_06430 [Treponema sp.]|nr:hypothetical protein [Treponema sp.]